MLSYMNSLNTPVIMWFRRDLRMSDNLALTKAAGSGRPVIALYILDEQSSPYQEMGRAQKWWLHHSLKILRHSLHDLGVPLLLQRGATVDVLFDVIAKTGAVGVYFTRQYEPGAISNEDDIWHNCHEKKVGCHRYRGGLLFEPETLLTPKGTPYKVYTPFSKRCFSAAEPRNPLPVPAIRLSYSGGLSSDRLEDWNLLPTHPNWADGFSRAWSPGEFGAHDQLTEFLDQRSGEYARTRDFPGIDGTSRLSPHLHFGEISPAQCWHATKHAHAVQCGFADITDDKFIKEILWREFATHLLFHFPTLPDAPLRAEYAAFPWANNPDDYDNWCNGRTGFPIVDAGMRQLWQTGWMHNRVRMVTASFLIKDLLIDWRKGAAWFHDTLVDADLASNCASWQWVAGSGADAAPFFRIFNPMLQGEKFDSSGTYIRTHLPELSELPAKYIHRPWEAPEDILREAGVVLGDTYPRPIVDHRLARERALAALKVVKSQRKAKLANTV